MRNGTRMICVHFALAASIFCLKPAEGAAATGDLVQVGGAYESCPWAINDQNVVVGVTSVPGEPYPFSFIDRPASGMQLLPFTDNATDINNSGAVLVHDAVGVWTTDGVLYGNLEGQGYASAINNSGVIVGASGVLGVRFSKTYFDGMWFYDALDLSGGYIPGCAYDINDVGTIVGEWAGRARRYTDAHGLVDLGAGSRSAAFGINEAGTIVGWKLNTNGPQQPFRYTDAGGIKMLSLPPTCTMIEDGGKCALQINNGDIVVGTAMSSTGMDRAVLWDAAGDAFDLNTWFKSVNPAGGAHWWLAHATGINNNGIVCGWGYYGDGQWGGTNVTRAFTLDVNGIGVPEPSSLALLVGGASILMRRKR